MVQRVLSIQKTWVPTSLLERERESASERESIAVIPHRTGKACREQKANVSVVVEEAMVLVSGRQKQLWANE